MTLSNLRRTAVSSSTVHVNSSEESLPVLPSTCSTSRRVLALLYFEGDMVAHTQSLLGFVSAGKDLVVVATAVDDLLYLVGSHILTQVAVPQRRVQARVPSP